MPIRLYLCVIAHPTQQPVGNARRTARAAGNFRGSPAIETDFQYLGGARHDMRQVRHLVKLQALHNAKAIAQGGCQQAGARSGPHQGKRRQVQLDGTSRRPLPYHDVQLVIFHRRIQYLLHNGTEAMNLINK